MNEEERCDTTLGLGIGVGIKREKQSKKTKKSLLLDLSLPLHPKIKANDRYQKNDEAKDDQGFLSSKTITDKQEEDRGIKRSVSNTNLYNNNDGSRKKLKLTMEQTTLLEDQFKTHSTLNTGQKQELAKKLNLLPRQIEVWFQNRRARTKLKHIEQEYEWLKKCFETLKDENSRLKKELQEVGCFSLKADNHQPLPQLPLPFYIRYPTTTVMMHNLYDKNGESKEITKVAVVNGGNMGHILHDDSNKKNAIVAKLL